MRVFSILILLLSFSLNVSCQFIPPPGDVCLGDSITYHCLLNGSFLTEQSFIINSTAFNILQINSPDTTSSIDLSRISATVNNTLDSVSTLSYTVLRANITLVNITKEDNNTLIGCRAAISGTTNFQIESDTLILASPPSEPSIQVVPIPPNCTVRVSWSYPSPPLTQHLSDSVSNSLSITSDRTYFSSPLTAGEEVSYTLLASHCLGEVTASARFTPPTQPDPIACSATYGTEDKRLVIQILGYSSGFSIETSFNLFSESDTVLTGNFSEDSPYYYSRDMFGIQATSNYTVRLTSALRNCIGSDSVMCEVKLNFTLMAPMTTIMITATTTTVLQSPPSTLPDYAVYIIIAVVLALVLLMLSIVILFLAYLLYRSRTSRPKSFPKKRLHESHPCPPELPETNANREELHYIQPDFSQTPDGPKPRAAFPQTEYAAMQSL